MSHSFVLFASLCGYCASLLPMNISRDALPAPGPAEGAGRAVGAEDPAAAGHDGLPAATGRD